MAERHTPGPWHVESVSYPERAHPQVYAGKKLVADPRNSKDVPAPESDHNARLIAAAPDLLVACEASQQCIMDFIDAYKRGCSMLVLDEAVKSLRDDALKLTSKALAKARHDPT